MNKNIFRQSDQIRKSDTYNDGLPAGSTLETNSTDIETDLNATRSQIKRVIYADNLGNWTDDMPIVGGIKYGIKKLAETVDSLISTVFQIDSFTPTFGQTVFSLSQLPINPNAPFVEINGQDLKATQSFSISGTILNISLPYQLDSSDDLVVKYYYINP